MPTERLESIGTGINGFIEALGWPHLTFAFAVFFVLLFMKPIGAFLARITSIGKLGIKTQPNLDVQRDETKGQNNAAYELMLAINDTPAVNDIEGRIRASLRERKLDVDSDTSRMLIKFLANVTLSLEFEQIHGLIFGSQISLLKKLNEVRGRGLSLTSVVEHFEATKKLNAEAYKEWSIDNYLNFLTTRNLVTFQGDDLHITNLGGDYLVWITRTGHSETKWF